MKPTHKKTGQLPKSFTSYDEACEFWDTHDVTTYLDQLEEVKVDVELKGRQFEIAVDEDVANRLFKRAKRERVPVGSLASRMLRHDLALTRA